MNNFFINDPNVYNLHKIDTKLDWIVNSKLRLSGRFGLPAVLRLSVSRFTVKSWAAVRPFRRRQAETTCSTAPGWRFPGPEVT